MYEKLKSLLLDDHVFFGLIVIIIAIASFGLGRFSVSGDKEEATKIHLINSPKLNTLPEIAALSSTSTPVVDATVGGSFVASKSGTKFHLISCPGAKQIKEGNKIYFSSKQEALVAGYKPAANCPGLQ